MFDVKKEVRSEKMNKNLGKMIAGMIIFLFLFTCFSGVIVGSNEGDDYLISNFDGWVRDSIAEYEYLTGNHVNLYPEDLNDNKNGDIDYSETIICFKKNIDITNIESYKGYEIIDKIEELNLALIKTGDNRDFLYADDTEENDFYFADPNLNGLGELCSSNTTEEFTPNDPYYPNQWGLEKIGWNAALNYTDGDYSITIAILDTGIDYDHEDFSSDHMINGPDFVSWQPWDDDSTDENGHGTACAGIASAVTNNSTGIAGISKSTVMGIRVCDEHGNPEKLWKLVKGIWYAANNGADIISMSFSLKSDVNLFFLPLILICKYAYHFKDVLLVASSGNYNSDEVVFPASLDCVIGVGAIDENSNRWVRDADHGSNYGENVNLVAPGVNIFTTYIGGIYGYETGTSVAAPFVAGVAALYYSLPTTPKDPALCKYCLYNSADDIGDEYHYGHGLLNASFAIENNK